MPRLVVLAVLAVLAVTTLAGCGGDDRLTAEELRRDANATCRAYERKLDALDTPDDLAGLAEYSRRAGEALRAGLADLRELEPPEELEADYERWLATGDDAVAQLDQLGDAAEREDEAAVQRLFDRSAAEDDESDRIAARIGLTACSDD